MQQFCLTQEPGWGMLIYKAYSHLERIVSRIALLNNRGFPPGTVLGSPGRRCRCIPRVTPCQTGSQIRMSHLCSSPPLRSWLLWMPSTWNWGACGKRFLSRCPPAVLWYVCQVCPYLYCPQAGREYGRVRSYHRQGPGSHSQTSLLLIHRRSGKRCGLLMPGAASAPSSRNTLSTEPQRSKR